MKCPGQDMQYWDSEAIYEVSCPKCDTDVEFYKDDTTRKCVACGHRFVNPKLDFGCAAYCKFAEQCIGTLPEDFIGTQEHLLKDKVAIEIKRYYKTDFGQIRQVSRLAHYAEQIGKQEQVNVVVVICSAYLKRTVPVESSSGSHLTVQETLEPLATASEILTTVGAGSSLIEEVHALLSPPGNDETLSPEQGVLADAELLLSVENQLKEALTEGADLQALILSKCHTRTGKQMGLALLKQRGAR
ncbi:MAG: phosphohydrolase [Desulfobulbaceae bacterium]|nr:MAG: phosphohydrolase [Desulfobulbaceae bacterium]